MVGAVPGLGKEGGIVRHTHPVDLPNPIDVLRLQVGSDQHLDVFQPARVSADEGRESSSSGIPRGQALLDPK